MHKLDTFIWSINTLYIQNQPIDQRMAHLETALSKAWSHLDRTNDRPTPWGMFVAPEYLFAKEVLGGGKKHVYGKTQRYLDESEKNRIVSWGEQLSEKYPQLIIIPGTVAWQKAFERTGRKVFNKSEVMKTSSRYDKAVEGVKHYAYQVLQKQSHIGVGDILDEKISSKLFTVSALSTSEKIQQINSLKSSGVGDSNSSEPVAQAEAYMGRNTAYVLYGGKVCLKYNKMSDFHESLVDQKTTVFIPGTKRGLFSIPIEKSGGRPIDFGMEICLDHNQKVFSISNSGKAVDIHLILSAFTSTVEGNCNVNSGGYIVHASAMDDCSNIFQALGGSSFHKDSLEAIDKLVLVDVMKKLGGELYRKVLEVELK